MSWVARTLPLVVVIGLALTSTPSAYAASTGQFGIRPANPGTDSATSGYFVLRANPGDTLHDSAVIANPGTIPVKVRVYPVDATTGQSGGAVYLNRDDPRADVAAWISVIAGEVDVAPGQQATVDFTVIVPPGVRTGEHLGGLVAELASDSPSASGVDGASQPHSGFGISVVTRAVSAVLLTVGQTGTPSLKITGATIVPLEGLPTLTLSLQSDGSGLVKPRGEVTMTDAAGKTVLNRQITIDTIVPGTAITYPVQAELPTQFGAYQVHVRLDFGGGAPAVFDGPVVVAAAPASPSNPVVIGSQRPVTLPAASVSATVESNVPSSTGMSPLVIVLASVTVTLLVVAICFGLYVRRSRGSPKSKTT